MIVDPSEGDRRVAVICLTLITSNPKLTTPSDRYVFCRGVLSQVAYHRLHKFFGFGVERVIGQVIGVDSQGYGGGIGPRLHAGDSGLLTD
jgi:hypothetical protein